MFENGWSQGGSNWVNQPDEEYPQWAKRKSQESESVLVRGLSLTTNTSSIQKVVEAKSFAVWLQWRRRHTKRWARKFESTSTRRSTRLYIWYIWAKYSYSAIIQCDYRNNYHFSHTNILSKLNVYKSIYSLQNHIIILSSKLVGRHRMNIHTYQEHC